MDRGKDGRRGRSTEVQFQGCKSLKWRHLKKRKIMIISYIYSTCIFPATPSLDRYWHFGGIRGSMGGWDWMVISGWYEVMSWESL